MAEQITINLDVTINDDGYFNINCEQLFVKTNNHPNFTEALLEMLNLLDFNVKPRIDCQLPNGINNLCKKLKI